MEYLFEWDRFRPEESDVRKWEEIIKSKYQIKDWRGDKYVMIDDNPHFLTGSFIRKSELVNKIFLELSEENVHEPSLRKAIKNWFEKNSKT
jgi:hypothetical protein